jgi:hypothetical protein
VRIPRYQTILFTVLLVASVGMGVALWQLRERAHQRLLSGQDSAPTQAPEVAPSEQATILLASDADGTLLAQAQSLPLPQDPGARARAVLGKLLDMPRTRFPAAPARLRRSFCCRPRMGTAGAVRAGLVQGAEVPNQRTRCRWAPNSPWST